MKAINRHRSEGLRLLHIGKPKKALKHLTEALSQNATDVECLIARSKCYLKMGHNNAAQNDIDKAIALNPNNIRSIMQKGNVHYNQGEFEKALLWYSKGKSINESNEDFLVNIDRAKVALIACVTGKAKKFLNTAQISNELLRKASFSANVVNEQKIERPHNHLLEELSIDRQYIVDILKEEKKRLRMFKKTKPTYDPNLRRLKYLHKFCGFRKKLSIEHGLVSNQIKVIAEKTLKYLDPREDFWQQRKPFYSRKQGHKVVRVNIEINPDLVQWTVQNLVLEFVHIEMLTFQGNFELAIEKANNVLKHLDDVLNPSDMSYHVISCDLFAIIGICFYKLGNYAESFVYHEKEFERGFNNRLNEPQSRALDYMGYLQFIQGKYEEAITIWKKKVGNVKSHIEGAWLYHEIARCYMGIDNFPEALKYANSAYSKAIQSMDESWKLNTTIIKAKIHCALSQFHESTEYFFRALDISKNLNAVLVSEEINKLYEDSLLKKNEQFFKDEKGTSITFYEPTSVKSDTEEHQNVQKIKIGSFGKRAQL